VDGKWLAMTMNVPSRGVVAESRLGVLSRSEWLGNVDGAMESHFSSPAVPAAPPVFHIVFVLGCFGKCLSWQAPNSGYVFYRWLTCVVMLLPV